MSLYAIPRTTDGSRLHPTRLAAAPPWSPTLEVAWVELQRVAHLFRQKGYPTQTVAVDLVLALAQRLAVLESANSFLRQLRQSEDR